MSCIFYCRPVRTSEPLCGIFFTLFVEFCGLYGPLLRLWHYIALSDLYHFFITLNDRFPAPVGMRGEKYSDLLILEITASDLGSIMHWSGWCLENLEWIDNH